MSWQNMGTLMVGLEEAFLSKVGHYFIPSPSETHAVKRLLSVRRQHPARTEILEHVDRHQQIIVLSDGWGYSFKDLPNGMRQIIDFLLPGDFFGLEGIFLSGPGLSFASITPVEVASISTQSLLAVSRQWPRLGGAMLPFSAAPRPARRAPILVSLAVRWEHVSELRVELYRSEKFPPTTGR